MSTTMAIMMVLMLVGFLGFGHHHGMTGGHDKEDHKEESVIQDDHGKETPCPDCPVEPEKNGDEMLEKKPGE